MMPIFQNDAHFYVLPWQKMHTVQFDREQISNISETNLNVKGTTFYTYIV